MCLCLGFPRIVVAGHVIHDKQLATQNHQHHRNFVSVELYRLHSVTFNDPIKCLIAAIMTTKVHHGKAL